jgi:hypothetical protein
MDEAAACGRKSPEHIYRARRPLTPPSPAPLCVPNPHGGGFFVQERDDLLLNHFLDSVNSISALGDASVDGFRRIFPPAPPGATPPQLGHLSLAQQLVILVGFTFGAVLRGAAACFSPGLAGVAVIALSDPMSVDDCELYDS